MTTQTVLWSSLRYPGIEHLSIDADESGIATSGVVIGVEDGTPFRLDYRLHTSPTYLLRGLDATLNGERSLTLKSDGEGSWFGADGAPLPALAGCLDIDISATPFTNTLPIRRLSWQVGQQRDFRMVFITAPTLEVSVDPQRYTCLRQSADGAVFRFESLSSDFKADLPIDASGLVLDYPALFRRVWPSASPHPPLT